MGEDDAPTEFAGVAEAETQSAYAWALEDDVEEDAGRGWLIPVMVVVASLVVTVAAGTVAYKHLREEATATAPSPTATSVKPTEPVSPWIPPSMTPKPKPPPPPPPVTVTAEPRSPDNPGYTATEMAAFDERFLNTMRAARWQIQDPALLTLRAHQVCIEFANGMTREGIVSKLVALAGGPRQQATSFVDGVSQSYPDCP